MKLILAAFAALLVAAPAVAEVVTPALPIKGCVNTYYSSEYEESGFAIHNFDCPHTTDFYAAIDGKLIWIESRADGDMERHELLIRSVINDKPIVAQYRFWSRRSDVSSHLAVKLGSQVKKGQTLGTIPTSYVGQGLYLYTFIQGDFGGSDPEDWFK